MSTDTQQTATVDFGFDEITWETTTPVWDQVRAFGGWLPPPATLASFNAALKQHFIGLIRNQLLARS